MEMHSCGAMGSCSLLSTSESRAVQECTIFTSRLSQTMWNLTVWHDKKQCPYAGIGVLLCSPRPDLQNPESMKGEECQSL